MAKVNYRLEDNPLLSSEQLEALQGAQNEA
jgi:hypothetical protein